MRLCLCYLYLCYCFHFESARVTQFKFVLRKITTVHAKISNCHIIRNWEKVAFCTLFYLSFSFSLNLFYLFLLFHHYIYTQCVIHGSMKTSYKILDNQFQTHKTPHPPSSLMSGIQGKCDLSNHSTFTTNLHIIKYKYFT